MAFLNFKSVFLNLYSGLIIFIETIKKPNWFMINTFVVLFNVLAIWQIFNAVII